ncbi:MAG: hypothetical protein PUF37_06995 [Prevotellaceae bacterium]|nr:hypothetical protein [Prevotellaceae bacterium]
MFRSFNIDPVVNHDLRVLNSEALELQDTLFPVDPVTGYRLQATTRLLDPAVSSKEKELIMSQLEKIPASSRSRLSDDELISLLPSRYNSTNTDMDKVRDLMTQIIDSMNKSDSSSSDASGSDASGSDASGSDV